jgi:hypothetical protein
MSRFRAVSSSKRRVLARTGTWRWPAQSSARAWRTSAPRATTSWIPPLTLSCALMPGQQRAAVEAVLDRVRSSGFAVETVIFDLSGTAGIDDEGCADLLWLHHRLLLLGTRLWLAVSARPVRDQLREAGVTVVLGTGAVHPSLRAAVLAAFSALPGPGLVTPQMRTALVTPAEPVLLEPGRPGSPVRFCSSSRATGSGQPAAGFRLE